MNKATTPADKQEKAQHISPGALIRQSGLLAVGAGAYMFVLPFVHPSDEVGMRSAAWVPVHLLYFAALALMLLVLGGSSPDNSSGPGGSAWPGFSWRSSAPP